MGGGRGSGLVLKIQGSPQVPHFPAFTCQWCCTGTRKKKFIQFGWGEGERLCTKDPGVTTGTTLSRIHLPVVLQGHEKKKFIQFRWGEGGGGIVLKIQGSPQVSHFPPFTCQWCCRGTRKKKFIQFGWGEGERLCTKDPGVATGTTLSPIHLPVVLQGHEKKKVHTVWVGGGGSGLIVLKIQGSPQVPHFPPFTCQWCCRGTRKKSSYNLVDLLQVCDVWLFH